MRRIYTQLGRWAAVGMLVACMLVGSVPIAFAAIPQLGMENVGNDRIRVMVSAADAFRSVDLYTRQLDTQLWTVYANIGTTDQYGALTASVTVGSFNPALARESYVVVAGQQSSVYVLNGFSGGGGTGLTISPSSLTLWSGQTADVWISGGLGSYYVASNVNGNVASTSIANSRLSVVAQSVGQTTIRVCAWGGYTQQYCSDVAVWVQGSAWQQIQFMTTALPQAVQSQYYTTNIQVSGGQTPYVFSLVSGQLPPGLALSPQGAVTGIPTMSGSYTVQVRVQDNYGASATQSLTLTVVAGSTGWGSALNGQLVNEGGTISIVYKGTKTGFAHADAFLGLGYTFGSVDQVYTGLPTSGRVVNTALAAHPWGSWVKSGQTVYFVHENGLIPVTAYDIFLQNGGQDRWVVLMNGYDWQKPILPYLLYSDTRLMGGAMSNTQRTMYGYVGQTLSVQLLGVVGVLRWNVLTDQSSLRVNAHYMPYMQSSGLAYEQIDLQPLQRGSYSVTFTNTSTGESIMYTFIIQ